MFLKSLISRIYKELSKSNNKETNNPLKWVKYMNTHFTKKMWYIYTMVYYKVIKRNNIGSSVETQMNLESVIQSEVSQKEKNKYSNTNTWNLETWSR